MIRIERDGGVGLLTLDRAERRNALTPEMLEALKEGVGTLAPDCRALVLAGAGRVFCAGFDLDLCATTPDGGVIRELLTELSGAIRALKDQPRPVVVAAHGAAVAGGCALLGGGDVVVADRGAKMGYPVLRLGVSPAVTAPFLACALPAGRVREWLIRPGLWRAEEAWEVGLVSRCVEGPGQVLGEAMDLARALAAKPAEAVGRTRALLGTIESEFGPAGMAGRGLEVSLERTGTEEERRMLAAALAAR